MGFRREPRTIPERIAAIEEQLRRTTTTLVVTGSGVAPGGLPKGLLNARGDLIVADGPDVAARLPVGGDTFVLTANSAQPHGVGWEPIPVDATAADAQMLTVLLDDA